MENGKKTNIASAFGWKLFERVGVQGTQFVMQLVLARLLDPEHYGVLSMMVIFTTLANVFIQSGLNTALIQNKDVTEEDYSSVLWVSLGIALLLYGMIFFAAPFIAVAYQMPTITMPLRVLALMLLPGALNSVQLAKVSREMDFRKVFTSSVAGVAVSGAAGITIAYMGGGLWALVAQTMLNVFISCMVMFFTVKWRPRLVCDIVRVKMLFSFGWKLLVSSLMDTLSMDLQSLIVGLKFNSATLGYYNRGKNFPQFIITAVGGTVQSVILPAMSAQQDSREEVKKLAKASITLSAFIIFPMMAGLAGVSNSLVTLLLTEKWLPCVPYLQIYCFVLAFIPIHITNLQTANALGRSDIFLKLEIIKKCFSISLLLAMVVWFDSPMAIAFADVITVFTGGYINAFPNRKLINYSFFEQLRDIAPSFLLSMAMLGCVLAVELLQLPVLLTLVIQIAVGVAVYVVLSALLRVKPFVQLLDMLKAELKRRGAV